MMQICYYLGDALQGQEWERQLPLVPVPELRADIQMEMQYLDGSVYHYILLQKECFLRETNQIYACVFVDMLCTTNVSSSRAICTSCALRITNSSNCNLSL